MAIQFSVAVINAMLDQIETTIVWANNSRRPPGPTHSREGAKMSFTA